LIRESPQWYITVTVLTVWPQRDRHSEEVLEALVQGLDDHDAECHGEVALQAMAGLSQVLPTVRPEHVRDIQVAVALRVKPFFEKVAVARLLGVRYRMVCIARRQCLNSSNKMSLRLALCKYNLSYIQTLDCEAFYSSGKI
jgi:hypothetical protein